MQFSAQYSAVQSATGVPVIVVAAIHERESDADFSTYLGNGDPLSRPSVHVPRGRGPFKTWALGAIDALTLDRLNQVTDWTWERACYEWELYNGFGPRSHGRKTGYVWAGTSVYDGGKYVSDGVWDPNTWDTQLGCFPVARAMVAFNKSLDLPRAVPAAPAPAPTPQQPVAPPIGVGGSLSVVQLQTDLNKLGVSPQLTVDGSYGRRTRNGVIWFQEKYNLEDVDGLCGPKTVAAIEKALAA
jgi:lysozyme family protein